MNELSDNWKEILIEECEEKIETVDKKSLELQSMQDAIITLEEKVEDMYKNMHKIIDNFNKK